MTKPSRAPGRPPVYDNGTETRSISFDADVLAQLDEYAEAHRMSRSRAVSVLVRDALNRRPIRKR